MAIISRQFEKNPISLLGFWLCKPAMNSIRKETNYEEAGGAPLLGVDGTMIISHGVSSAKAIRNAIRVAGEVVNTKVNYHIVDGIKTSTNPPDAHPPNSHH